MKKILGILVLGLLCCNVAYAKKSKEQKEWEKNEFGKIFSIIQSDADFQKWMKLKNKAIKWEDLLANKNVSFECKQRIEKVKPENFGQLQRIEGIRPATLAFVAGNI